MKELDAYLLTPIQGSQSNSKNQPNAGGEMNMDGLLDFANTPLPPFTPMKFEDSSPPLECNPAVTVSSKRIANLLLSRPKPGAIVTDFDPMFLYDYHNPFTSTLTTTAPLEKLSVKLCDPQSLKKESESIQGESISWKSSTVTPDIVPDASIPVGMRVRTSHSAGRKTLGAPLAHSPAPSPSPFPSPYLLPPGILVPSVPTPSLDSSSLSVSIFPFIYIFSFSPQTVPPKSRSSLRFGKASTVLDLFRNSSNMCPSSVRPLLRFSLIWSSGTIPEEKKRDQKRNIRSLSLSTLKAVHVSLFIFPLLLFYFV